MQVRILLQPNNPIQQGNSQSSPLVEEDHLGTGGDVVIDGLITHTILALIGTICMYHVLTKPDHSSRCYSI